MSADRPPTPAEATVTYASLAACLVGGVGFYWCLEADVVTTIETATILFAGFIFAALYIAPRAVAWWLGRPLESITDPDSGQDEYI